MVWRNKVAVVGGVSIVTRLLLLAVRLCYSLMTLVVVVVPGIAIPRTDEEIPCCLNGIIVILREAAERLETSTELWLSVI